MKRKQLGYTTEDLAVAGLWMVPVILVVAGLVGWVMNIVKLAGSDFAVFTGLMVVRIIGIVLAPIGAVVGYF